MPHIDVKVYNEAHRQLLGERLTPEQMARLVGFEKNGLDCTPEEFAIHTVFREQRKLANLQTYNDMKVAVPKRWALLRDYFDFEGETIRVAAGVNEVDTTQTDGVGVAGALITANRIFGLHEADWERIDVSQVKDLDFSIASGGDQFIEVEAKGTVVDDPMMAASVAKASIEEKKKEQRGNQGNQNLLLGVITAVPEAPGRNAVCQVLDPAPHDLFEDPVRYKLLARLHFYTRVISWVFSRGHLTVALRNRLNALEHLANIAELDSVALTKASGEEFDFTNAPPFPDRAYFPNERVVGKVFHASGIGEESEFYFVGVGVDVLDLVARQSFGAIEAYASRSAGHMMSGRRFSVGLVVDDSELQAARVDLQRFPRVPNLRKRIVEMQGPVYRSQSGLAIGRLRIMESHASVFGR